MALLNLNRSIATLGATLLIVGLIGGLSGALSISAAATAAASPGATYDPNYARYAALLGAVVRNGRVDYAGLIARRAELDQVGASFATLDTAAVARLDRNARLAYWINAYNVFVLQTVVANYPLSRGSLIGIAFPSNSIWQIPDAFKGARFEAGGARRSLDEIEHKIIRPQFREPRIHMGLVCAAISCPPLRAEPFVGLRLDAQLDEQTRNFIADSRHGVRIDTERRQLSLSSIFKWFGEDFAPPGAGRAEREQGLREFVARHLADAAAAQALLEGDWRVRYLDYDWTLNDL